MKNIKFARDYLTKNSYKMLEDNNNYAIQSVNLAIEALEKQIPIKIEKGTEGELDWFCICGRYLTITKDKSINYCRYCGQKLDWD